MILGSLEYGEKWKSVSESCKVVRNVLRVLRNV